MKRLRSLLAGLSMRSRQPVFPSTYWMMSCAWLCPAMYVVAKLDVAERLRNGPLTIEQLAAGCGVETVPLLQVMRAGRLRSLHDGSPGTLHTQRRVATAPER